MRPALRLSSGRIHAKFSTVFHVEHFVNLFLMEHFSRADK
jgi:hypothetical protein